MTNEMVAIHSPNTLGEALSMRYSSVWLHTVDTVEVIQRVRTHIATYDDVHFYLFNALGGLVRYNYHTSRFDTVLQIKETPMGPIQVPIDDIGEALDFLKDDFNATLLILNSEQFDDKLNDIHTSLGFMWRDSWSVDTSDKMSLQVLFASSTEPHPPEAVKSYVPTVTFGMPTKDDFVQLLSYVKEKTNAEVDIPAAAIASRGLSSFEAIKLYHSMAARSGKIDHESLQQLTFERLAARTGLDIIQPTVSLDQVAGGESLKKILELSIWVRENPEEAARLGHRKSMHRFLMLGLPGTGKSMLCEAAANYLSLNLIRTGVSQMLSKWHGESENNMRGMFQQIGALDPVCVWCDEFGRDVAGGQSSHVVDGGSTARMHGILLTGMQELAESTYFFAAANDISTLAPEMLRADRFDRVFFVGFPTYEQRMKIISDKLAGIDHEVEVEPIAAATAGYTGAELITGLIGASSISLSEMRATNTKDVKIAMTQITDRIWNRHRSHVTNEYKLAFDRYQWASEDQKAEAKDYIAGNLPKPKSRVIGVTNPNAEKVEPVIQANQIKANLT